MQMVHVRRCAAMACAARRWFAERGVGLDGGIATDSGSMRVGDVGDDVAVEVGRAQRVGAGQFMGMHLCVGRHR